MALPIDTSDCLLWAGLHARARNAALAGICDAKQGREFQQAPRAQTSTCSKHTTYKLRQEQS